MITPNELHLYAPAFITTDTVELAKQQAAIAITFASNNGYPGLPTNVQPIAESLAAAAYLTDQINNEPEVNTYKSYDDTISYHKRDLSQLNPYKTQLESLLDNQSFPVSTNGICGDCEGGLGLDYLFYLGQG